MRILLSLLAIPLSIAIVYWAISNKPKPPPVTAIDNPWQVAAQPLQFAALSPSITLFGKIDSPRNTTLKAALSADIVELPVSDGQSVQAGQTLVKLDPEDARLALEERQAQQQDILAQIDSEKLRHQADQQALPYERKILKLNQQAVHRARKLLGQKLGSQAQLDDALAAVEKQRLAIVQRQLSINEYPAKIARLKASLKQAQSLVTRAQRDLNRSTIRAPYRARIAQVHIAIGDRVRAGDPLIELFDDSQLRVRAQIPNAHIRTLQQAIDQGQTLHASAQVDGQTLQLSLNEVGAQVADSGSVEALFSVDGGEHQLPLGRFVTVKLTLPAVDRAFQIPSQALYGTDRIYSIENGKLQSHRIQRLGYAKNHGDLIASPATPTSPLHDGSDILTTQLPNAIDGLHVRIIDTPQP